MPAIMTDEIRLKTGETTSITLNGLATAGYQWNYTIEGDKDCVEVSKDYAPLRKSIQKNVGASADEVFTITAQKKGTANIYFSQQRSWEKSADASNEKKVTVTVE
jgi:predicted secreted protein